MTDSTTGPCSEKSVTKKRSLNEEILNESIEETAPPLVEEKVIESTSKG